MEKKLLEEIVTEVVDSSLAVHKALGPGLLESAYQKCLAVELTSRGFSIELEKPLPIIYNNTKIECGYRLDILVEKELIVELKAVEKTLPLHLAQLLTYLKLLDKSLGLLINFNVPLIKQGIRRVVNNY